MFRGLAKLEILVLTGNPLMVLSDGALSAMSSLQELLLNKAKLTHIKGQLLRHNLRHTPPSMLWSNL